MQNTASRETARRTRPRGYLTSYNPQQKTLDLLAQVQAVLEEYRANWPLSVRQVFYRLVGAHGYDKTERAYSRLCEHVGNARRAKLIPFRAIRDDGVLTYHRDHFADRDAFLSHVRRLGQNYTRDKLAGQPVHLEVWCEAAGMVPQLDDVAEPYSVRVYSGSGFDSITSKKEIADRVCRKGKEAIVLHLGDYDPSGESIFNSMAEDVRAFVLSDRPHGLVDVRFERVALTAEQVQAYDLPTAPAKVTDTRSRGWKGETCQLEALPPDVIAGLLRDAITRHFDCDQLADDEAAQEDEREEIQRLLLPAPGA